MAQYQGKKSNKKAETSSEAAIVEGILTGIFNLLKMIVLGIYGLFKKGGAATSGTAEARQKVKDGWEHVEFHLSQEATAVLAVSEADKLLDLSLQIVGAKGMTLGERLQDSRSRFPNDLYQEVWNAHKLRNTLAHEVGAQVSMAQARTAVTSLRNALYHLGVL